MRLQKYLAQCGIGSRRKSEQYILDGKVKVNGETITTLGTKVSENDEVLFMGKSVKIENQLIYIMLNKPAGYITAVTDQFNRPTVVDLIKEIDTRIYPVGRLDYDTSGLLILTNDGNLTYKLTHPKHDIEKTYIANLYGIPTDDELKLFREGVIIDGQKTVPAKIEIIKKDGRISTVKIVIVEGRNRQVKKMCEAIGYKVKSLKRIGTGELYLDNLKEGQYRHLTKKELDYLKSL